MSSPISLAHRAAVALALGLAISSCAPGRDPLTQFLATGQGCVTFSSKAYATLFVEEPSAGNAFPMCGTDGEMYLESRFHREAPVGVCRDPLRNAGGNCGVADVRGLAP